MTSINWNINLENSVKRIYNLKITDPTNIIEIGCFEGYGTLKLEELIGSHQESKIYCVDPWEEGYVLTNPQFADINPIFVGQWNKFQNITNRIKDKIIIKRGYSNDMLPTIPEGTIDFAYIDGDHSANQVYIDGKLNLPLMKYGGIILFDDYYWTHNGEVTQIGIEKFISEFADKIEVLFKGPVQCAVKLK